MLWWEDSEKIMFTMGFLERIGCVKTKILTKGCCEYYDYYIQLMVTVLRGERMMDSKSIHSNNFLAPSKVTLSILFIDMLQ